MVRKVLSRSPGVEKQAQDLRELSRGREKPSGLEPRYLQPPRPPPQWSPARACITLQGPEPDCPLVPGQLGKGGG